jgi:hypothetical protein
MLSQIKGPALAVKLGRATSFTLFVFSMVKYFTISSILELARLFSVSGLPGLATLCCLDP